MKDLSIIIPVFNCKKYIDRCLSSVLPLRQNLNLEIIVVDDCSSDDSLKKISKYQTQHNFIKVFSNKTNLGVSASRNVGLQHATGKYIFFLDIDDFVDTNNFEKITNLTGSGHEIICFSVISIKNSKPVKNDFVCENTLTLSKHQLFNNQRIFVDANTATWIKNKLYLREVIKTHNLRFDENLSFSEDLQFNLNFFKHIKSILFVDFYSVYYDRDIPSSLSKIKEKNYITEFVKATKMITDFFDQNGVTATNDFFEDRKNLLTYSIEKVLSSKCSRQCKLGELETLLSKDIAPFVKNLNNKNPFEEKIISAINQNNINLLLNCEGK